MFIYLFYKYMSSIFEIYTMTLLYENHELLIFSQNIKCEYLYNNIITYCKFNKLRYAYSLINKYYSNRNIIVNIDKYNDNILYLLYYQHKYYICIKNILSDIYQIEDNDSFIKKTIYF